MMLIAAALWAAGACSDPSGDTSLSTTGSIGLATATSATATTTTVVATTLAAAPSTTAVPTTERPDEPGSPTVGVIAIGHSGLTGENSDPDHRGSDAPANSWATGTSPDVDSIYERLVAARPETDGHVANTAEGGALAALLPGQARAALKVVPAPQLVIIQTIDNDIQCDGTDDQHIAAFGNSVAAALDEISTASPNSRILIVGQLGRPSATYAQQLTTIGPAATDGLTGTDICSFFDPAGTLQPDHLATLTKIIDGYEAEEARVCALVPHCATDGGVRAAWIDELDYFTPDWNHLNVDGLAHEADQIWPTVAGLLGVPPG